MDENKYIEYTIYNPTIGKYQQIVVNDSSETVQIYSGYLEINGYFESEAYHLDAFAKEHGLIIYRKEKEYTPIKEILKED